MSSCAAALLHVARAGVGGARLGQLVRDARLADLGLVLAAVHLGRALVHRVPALHLVAEHVHVVVERLERRRGALVRELHRLVDDLDRLAVQFLEALLVQVAGLLQELRVGLDRVALAPLLHLLLGPVDLGVGRGVAAEAVGERLDQRGLAILARHAQVLGDALAHRQHVHAVDPLAGHAEALGLRREVRHGGVARQRRAHPVLVVDDQEHDRQLPQRGEVHGLAERALVGGAVAEHAHRHGVLALVVGGERHAGGQRQVAADDPVAAQEAPLQVEQVHRAAAAA